MTRTWFSSTIGVVYHAKLNIEGDDWISLPFSQFYLIPQCRQSVNAETLAKDELATRALMSSSRRMCHQPVWQLPPVIDISLSILRVTSTILHSWWWWISFWTWTSKRKVESGKNYEISIAFLSTVASRLGQRENPWRRSSKRKNVVIHQ